MYLIVAARDAEGHPIKGNRRNTEAEAQDLVARIRGRYPDAFYAQMPDEGEEPYWIADPVAKTVTLDGSAWDARSVPEDPPSTRELWQMLKTKGVLADQDRPARPS